MELVAGLLICFVGVFSIVFHLGIVAVSETRKIADIRQERRNRIASMYQRMGPLA